MKIINNPSIEKAKIQIKKANPPIIVQARDDVFNRKLLEYGKFDVILSIEKGNQRRHTIRQIDSGLNHVLAKIATKNRIKIGIDIKEISRLSKNEKARRLSKIRQNIQICKKARTKLTIINLESKKDAQYFLLSLGASTSQAKEAT